MKNEIKYYIVTIFNIEYDKGKQQKEKSLIQRNINGHYVEKMYWNCEGIKCSDKILIPIHKDNPYTSIEKLIHNNIDSPYRKDVFSFEFERITNEEVFLLML